MLSAKKCGFTIFEVSLCLIIIGILFVGVMKASILVTSAQITTAVGLLKHKSQAIATFIAQYNCIPGDCKNASTLIQGAYNGNGDGILHHHSLLDKSSRNESRSNVDDATRYNEYITAEQNLYISKLMPAKNMVYNNQIQTISNNSNAYIQSGRDLQNATYQPFKHIYATIVHDTIGLSYNWAPIGLYHSLGPVTPGSTTYLLPEQTTFSDATNCAVHKLPYTGVGDEKQKYYIPIDTKFDDGNGATGNIACGVCVAGVYSNIHLPISYDNGYCISLFIKANTW